MSCVLHVRIYISWRNVSNINIKHSTFWRSTNTINQSSHLQPLTIASIPYEKNPTPTYHKAKIYRHLKYASEKLDSFQTPYYLGAVHLNLKLLGSLLYPSSLSISPTGIAIAPNTPSLSTMSNRLNISPYLHILRIQVHR